jgi:hypothetical protein
MKPRVITRCIASQYAMKNERIVEFSFKENGGLISFHPGPDGTLFVDVYRTDPGVIIRAHGQQLRAPVPADGTS